jgi:hypothetical protein
MATEALVNLILIQMDAVLKSRQSGRPKGGQVTSPPYRSHHALNSGLVSFPNRSELSSRRSPDRRRSSPYSMTGHFSLC